jgi:tRNA-uridine 2-sulfurtransferase
MRLIFKGLRPVRRVLSFPGRGAEQDRGKAEMAERVAVAMSGGVDSSVAAALLLEQGFEVIGFSMQLWDQKRNISGDDFQKAGRCCSIDDLYDARGVASRLGIPYYVVNLQKEFENKVVRSFIENYRDGLTPSPCVLCNSHLKFDRLLQMASEVNASHVATGHYARVKRDISTGCHTLLRGIDADKDQSYFLFELRQDQLARAMFPLGGRTKTEVRDLARKYGLEVSEKPESQEICFVPDGDYASFIERHHAEVVGEVGKGTTFKEGDIIDAEGRFIGKHPGIHHFTIGQRRGLGIAHSEPLYVIKIDAEKNVIVVGPKAQTGSASCRVIRTNWILPGVPDEPLKAFARIRSRHKAAPAVVTPEGDGAARVEFEAPQMAVSPGQACVFYQGDRVIGGGWIDRPDAGGR